jgi:nucleotide-binding universal stress UspA family protein
VLFATDFGPASLKALPYAASLAHKNQSRLVLLHVLPPVPVVEPGTLWYLGSGIDKMRTAADAAARARLRELVPHDLGAEYMVEFGDPVDGILKTAARCEAGLIVIGVKKASAASVHLPWAIAHQIVDEAECPVLTVRD